MSDITFQLEEINMLDFLIEESKADYVKAKILQIRELYKLFITTTIKEDRKILSNFKVIQKTIDPENIVTDTELKDLSKYIDNYNTKFLIFLLKTQCDYSNIDKSLINELKSRASSGYPVNILEDKFRTTLLKEKIRKERVGVEAFKKMKRLNLPLTKEIVDKWYHANEKEERNMIDQLDYLISKEDLLIHKQNINPDQIQLPNTVPVLSGGGKEGYEASKGVLERVAEPKHDFGGDRAPFLNKTIRTNYSADYDDDYDLQQFDSDIKVIDDIFAGSEGIEKIASKGWNTGKLAQVKRAILQCKDTIKATIHSSSLFEATTFSRMFLNSEFENISDDMSNLNKYNSFKFFSCKAEIQQFATLTSEGSAKIKLAKDAVFENLRTIIRESGIKYHVYDTSAFMPGVNHFLTEMGLEKITPLVNIWDPATASVDAFNKHTNSGEGFKPGGFVTNKEDFIKDIKDTTPIQLARRDTPTPFDYPTFKVEYNDSDGEELYPIKLTVNFPDDTPSSQIKLKSGFSVSMLDEIARSVSNGQAHDSRIIQPDICISENDGNDGITEFIGSLKTYANDDDTKKKVVRLLLDMKKSGDWGQVKWVNTVPTGYESLFVSGDKLCALYSILHNNSTIFGNPGLVRNFVTKGDSKSDELSATIGLFIQPKELSDSDLIQNYESLKEQIKKLLNSENSIFDKALQEGSEDILSKIINNFLDSIGLITLDSDESKKNHMKSAIKLAKLLLDILNNINKLSNNKIEDIHTELNSFNTSAIKAMAKQIVPNSNIDSIIGNIQIFNDKETAKYSNGSRRAKTTAKAIFDSIAGNLNIAAESGKFMRAAKSIVDPKAAKSIVDPEVDPEVDPTVDVFECPNIEKTAISQILNFSTNVNSHLGIQHIFQVLPNLFSTIFDKLVDLCEIKDNSDLNYYRNKANHTQFIRDVNSINPVLEKIATILTMITLEKFGKTLDTNNNNSWEFGNESDTKKYKLRSTEWNNLSVRDISLELTKAKLLIDCVLKNNKRLDNIKTDELDVLYKNFDGIQRKMITELMPLAQEVEKSADDSAVKTAANPS